MLAHVEGPEDFSRGGGTVATALKLMVSSTVYGHEELLNQVFAVLKGYGYDVWMSHKGTLPLTPGLSAFENCLTAVRDCDLFLALITGRYGSGKEGESLSITHNEVLRAIELNKPRFFLVHRDVITARHLLRQFRKDGEGKPRPHTFFKPTPIFDDVRILDLYDAAVRSDLPLSERRDNWAQEYDIADDVLRYLTSQFSDPERIRRIVRGEEK
jgi:hypothetical protein